MRVAEERAAEQLQVCPKLRLGVQTGTGIVEIDLALSIEARVLSRAKGFDGSDVARWSAGSEDASRGSEQEDAALGARPAGSQDRVRQDPAPTAGRAGTRTDLCERQL